MQLQTGCMIASVRNAAYNIGVTIFSTEPQIILHTTIPLFKSTDQLPILLNSVLYLDNKENMDNHDTFFYFSFYS